VVAFLALVALAAAGILIAVFCIGTGTSGPSLGRLAVLLHLPALRNTVGHWLTQLEASGSVAVVAGVCGLGAVVIGLVLVVGTLVPRRERLITLARDEGGVLAARRRPLAQAAAVLVEQVRGVTESRVRVRPLRGLGGRMAVRASRSRPTDPVQLETAVRDQLRGLSEPFQLRTRVEVRRGGRVE
jgi:hypothetical protein